MLNFDNINMMKLYLAFCNIALGSDYFKQTFWNRTIQVLYVGCGDGCPNMADLVMFKIRCFNLFSIATNIFQ